VIITAAVWSAFAGWMQIDSCALLTVARDADDASDAAHATGRHSHVRAKRREPYGTLLFVGVL
jgi:hypothetical protein